MLTPGKGIIMAKTRISQIANMSVGEVGDDTRVWFRVAKDEEVKAMIVEYNEYIADTAAWITANPGREEPEFVEASNVEAPTMPEKTFVEVRFKVTHNDGSSKTKVRADWIQVNSTNFPGIAANLLASLKIIFDARRTHLGLDPV